jgi:hypothetical protein
MRPPSRYIVTVLLSVFTAVEVLPTAHDHLAHVPEREPAAPVTPKLERPSITSTIDGGGCGYVTPPTT